MLTFPYPLAEIDSKVLETTEHRRVWYLGNPAVGAEVDDEGRLDELTGSCYFALPKLDAAEGPVSILAVARGRPATAGKSRRPSIWNPLELHAELGGVYVSVTYHPSRSEFEIGMNVGSETKELLGVTLEGAPPELVCGRVLELYFEISEERIFVSVHNRFMNGDVSLDGLAPSTGQSEKPWGVPATGHWWVMVGVDGRADRTLPLPVGFGLSNLRITLGADTEEAMGSMLYDGALDHLVADPPKRLSVEDLQLFTEHVKTLRRITTDVERIRLLLPISPPLPAP